MNTFRAGIASNLVDIGRDEDGEPVIREFYYVRLESESGFRYVSEESSRDLTVIEAQLAQVNEALAAGFDPSTADGWNVDFPAYGSSEYQSWGGEAERQWERSLDS